MSLTGFLELPDVKEKFRQEFTVPIWVAQKQPVAPPLSERGKLIGTAFDYLLRFYLQRLNDEKAIRRSWVAEAALERLPYCRIHIAGYKGNLVRSCLPNGDEYFYGTSDFHTVETVIEAKDHPAKKVEPVFSRAWAEHERYIVSGEITDELIKSTIYLAQLDVVVRARILYADLGVAHQEDVQDLRNLIMAVIPDFFIAKEICLLNPTFGSASTLVGGADADLLIDDTLVEIKTTKDFKLKPEYFYQLLGYFVLHSLAGIGDLVPKRDIKKLAIYYSRQAHLEVFELQDIVNPETFPGFVEWFSARAKQYLRDAYPFNPPEARRLG